MLALLLFLTLLVGAINEFWQLWKRCIRWTGKLIALLLLGIKHCLTMKFYSNVNRSLYCQSSQTVRTSNKTARNIYIVSHVKYCRWAYWYEGSTWIVVSDVNNFEEWYGLAAICSEFILSGLISSSRTLMKILSGMMFSELKESYHHRRKKKKLLRMI